MHVGGPACARVEREMRVRVERIVLRGVGVDEFLALRVSRPCRQCGTERDGAQDGGATFHDPSPCSVAIRLFRGRGRREEVRFPAPPIVAMRASRAASVARGTRALAIEVIADMDDEVRLGSGHARRDLRKRP